jgi:chromosome segregation ATPase
MQKEFEQQLPAITNAIENARLQLNSNQFQFQKLCTVMDSKATAIHSLKLEITDAHSKLGNVQAQIAVAETEFEGASSANEKLEQARETLRKRVDAAAMNRDKIAKICQNRMTAMSKRIVCFRCKYDAARAHPSVDSLNTASVTSFSREELIEALGRNQSVNMVAQVQLEPSLQLIQTDAKMARRQVEEYLERWHCLLSPCVHVQPKFEHELSKEEKSKYVQYLISKCHLNTLRGLGASC